jgi:ribonuclease HI
VTLKTCPNLNPASLLPTEGDALSHFYEEVLSENYTPRPNLLDMPLPDPDLTLFTDGSSSVNNGEQQARAAVVMSAQILWTELPQNTSAQLAEHIALTKALQFSQGKRVNIYTDSKYTFLILCAHVAIWREQRMLTASGSPIKHSQIILKLLDVVLLPQQVAVIFCLGHQKTDDPIPLGNKKADAAAKEAAQ